MFAGTTQQSHVDNANPLAKQRLETLVESLPLGNLFARIWGSRNVWYFAEEVFLKAGGQGSRTLWHQDTSYLPWAGEHWGNAWISFESIPQRNALEIIRGSHRGPRYDGTTFTDPDDPTQPLHDNGTLPRLPDIEAERKLNPGAYDVLSWATEPGDVILLHPASLHGGAPVDSDFLAATPSFSASSVTTPPSSRFRRTAKRDTRHKVCCSPRSSSIFRPAQPFAIPPSARLSEQEAP